MIRFICGLLIWLLLTIVLCVPLGILAIYKLIVTALSKCRGGRDEEWFPLTPSDNMFAPGSSWVKSIVNFGAVMRLKERNEGGFFSAEELRSHFTETFLQDDIKGGKYDKLSSYLEMFGGIVFRVHTKRIDLQDHIYEVTKETNKTVEDFLVDWLLTPYKRKKPCWEMILLRVQPPTGKESGEMLLAFKMHHSLADGYSLLHMIDKLTGGSSPYLVRDFEHSTLSEIKKIIESPTKMGMMKPPAENPFKVVLSEEKRFEAMVSFTTLPLEDLKRFRRKHGVHMSSVIVTMIIGAQRKFLEKELDMKIPDEIAVAATTGWPRHPSRDHKVSNRDKLCNQWSSTFGKASFLEEDRVILLKEVDKSMFEFEEEGIHFLFKRVMLPCFWTVPSALIASMMPQSGMFGAGVTPIVGGDNYTLLGCSVENIHPYMAYHDLSPSAPFACFTFSHSGKLEVTFIAHPSLYKNQETLDRVLHQYMHEEFNALMKC